MLTFERTSRALQGVRRHLACLALLIIGGSCARGMCETIAPADNSGQAQQQATAAIPFDQLTEEAQAKLFPVVSRPSIYRRLPAELISCERDMYLTLIRNPEIVVGIWHLMEVTEMDMRRSGPFTFDCDDSAGTTSQIELIYGDANTHLFYADTLYEGPLFARPVKGRVVILLRSEYAADEQGNPQVKSVMDAFIRIDHITAKLVARTMAPMVGRTADHNFSESFRFVARVNEAAVSNGPGVRQLATRLENVDVPIQRRFAEVATIVNQRAATRRELSAVPVNATTAGAAPNRTDAAEPAPTGPTASILDLPQRDIQLRR